jgi:F0F1-type ATP synthase assembly protein I
MLQKLSSADVDTIMIKAASALRAQDVRIAELEAEIARRDRIEHAQKIASAARERGVMDEDDAVEYAEKLASSDEDLTMVEDLVSRVAVGVPLGRAHEKVASAGDDETDVLTAFLLNSDLAG